MPSHGLFYGIGAPLIGTPGVNAYNGVQDFKQGDIPTTNPINNPFAAIFEAEVHAVEALPPSVDQAVNIGIEIVDDVAEAAKETVKAVEHLTKDAFHSLEWILDHPALVIIGIVGTIAGIAYLASNKTNISVTK